MAKVITKKWYDDLFSLALAQFFNREFHGWDWEMKSSYRTSKVAIEEYHFYKKNHTVRIYTLIMKRDSNSVNILKNKSHMYISK